MDHDPLTPLFSPLTTLKGVGPTVGALIAKVAGGERVIDLLFHLPESYLDRRQRPTIAQARPGQVVTLAVEVVRHEPPANARQPWRVVVTDGDRVRRAGLLQVQPRAADAGRARGCWCPARSSCSAAGATMPHPDHVVPADRPDLLPCDRAGLAADRRPVAAAGGRTPMAQALARLPALPEWHDAALLRREKWPGFAEGAARGPGAAGDAGGGQPVPARLRRTAGRSGGARDHPRPAAARPGRGLTGDGALRAKALSRFGHALTGSQKQALAEIDADLASDRRMLRLLQGDVGSGKTVVALLAMLRAVEAGKQAAMMAPTEVLAKQHHRTLSRLSPAPVALLTGGVKGRARAQLLRGLKDGAVPLVVGTHALFQESVEYHDLALAVIDEQHRFGVDQRLLLGGKGELTDVLVMTATPIPRTLLLTQWGEMDVSRLTEKPPGRQAVRTSLHSLGTLPDLLDAVARKLDEGAQVYWVCPLVAESEAVDLAAAEARFAVLRERFGDAVGLAHGQQDAAVRDATLAAFAAGGCRLLVATTVVEVGVDVPAATVMVIEHAERFGLAQLHQLRGRVGRGAAASFCLLLHEEWVNDAAKRRLTLLRDTDDGFLIADEDFRLRGGGDLLGTKQSGMPGFRLADPIEHEGLLHMANRDAAVLLGKDPKLVSERGRAVRVLLRLFEKAAAMRTLAAG